MEKKNATPSVRQLLCASAEKYGEEIFIKFVRNGAVEERSYVRVKTDSEAVCRWIRSISKEGMHVAVVSKTNYEYITCITGILMSGSVVVPFAPDISAKRRRSFLTARISIWCSMTAHFPRMSAKSWQTARR